MASITIRKPGDGARTRLRIPAAANGRFMEEEGRAIPREAAGSGARPQNLAGFDRAGFA